MGIIERMVQKFAFMSIFLIAVAIVFLGFAIPMAILTDLGRKLWIGSDADLWFLAICVIPTSLFGLVLMTKALIRQAGRKN